MSNRLYIDGALVAIIMAFVYLIVPIPIIGYAVFVAYGFIGLMSRLLNPMGIVRIGAEIMFIAALLIATPDSMQDMSMYFIKTYILFAYIGTIINALIVRYVEIRIEKEESDSNK